MAKTTITKITDDLDGSDNASSYTFSWGKDQYEIDLSEKNVKELEDFLGKYIDVASKETARLPRERSASSSAPKSNKEYLTKVRSWASQNGHEVNARGRVAQSVIDAYEKAAH
ncbi:Lsr2 family protein [Pseudarthrobacter sp. HLT3-5]|uniref:histone-like nucleoid-structuring protein Lsr2 n=1 Tax=Pseudarthrobacter cellobiosi TaxID=2953654 RepID=UPI00208E24C7|nr:Lsr2 family protein [Pseudarthrobacter sp. HLT3-5]MCO4274255.1 Lsr2 family protein [Pseudarthrobacter sp. HLT3-5]